MPDALRHGQELAGLKRDLAIGEFDNQIPIDSIESLVGIGMMVPGETVRHHAHADFMIVHGGDATIVIGLVNLAAELQGIDGAESEETGSGVHGQNVAFIPLAFQ